MAVCDWHTWLEPDHCMQCCRIALTNARKAIQAARLDAARKVRDWYEYQIVAYASQYPLTARTMHKWPFQHPTDEQLARITGSGDSGGEEVSASTRKGETARSADAAQAAEPPRPVTHNCRYPPCEACHKVGFDQGQHAERSRAVGIISNLLPIIDGLTDYDRAGWEQRCGISFNAYKAARAVCAGEVKP